MNREDGERFFELSLDFLVVFGRDGTIERHNQALQDELGYPEGKLVGLRLATLGHPDDREAIDGFLKQLAAGERVERFRCRLRGADGVYRNVRWRAAPMAGTGRIHAAGRDVTEQSLLETQLLQSQKMDAVGQLAGGVAHDFNNLVLAILVNADFALQRIEDDQTREELHEIKRAGERAATVTRQLLAFSRQQAMDLGDLDLNDLVEGLSTMLQRVLPADIELDIRLGPGLAKVRGDVGQLEQVVVNLCLNARDAMPQGGRLTVEAKNVVIEDAGARPRRFVRLSVTDTGTGMSPELRERICEPFFTTKPEGKGTGLGLATVYGIVEQHEGMLQIHSEVGEGSTFSVDLPASQRRSSDVRNKVEAPAMGGTECILVVEDTQAVRGIVVRILEDAGYRVVAAADGTEALAMLASAEHDVQAALIDVVMPGMSGPVTGQALLEQQPALRILYTSGYNDGETERHGLTREQLLDKPYRPTELLRRLRLLLDEPAP